MKLIIVRHAAAVDRSGGITEEQRYLTPEGRAFFRKTARTMLEKGLAPELILTSPLLRAVQTADILAEALSFGGELAARDELRPGFGRQALQALLDEFPSVKELVLVGHEPDLSSLISSLLALPGRFNFQKGAAVKLKIDPADLHAPASFKWLAAGGELTTTGKEAFES